MENSTDMIRPAEAAIARGVGVRTVWNWLERQWIQRFTDSGRHLVSRSEVMAFVPPKRGLKKGAKRCTRYGIIDARKGIAPQLLE